MRAEKFPSEMFKLKIKYKKLHIKLSIRSIRSYTALSNNGEHKCINP
jgi:hypothetical protein